MKVKNRAVILFIFNIILFAGCFWQIINVCKLYFNYPVNIFIDTKFNVLTQRLPALTFCSNVGNMSEGKNSSDALEHASKMFKDEMFSMIIVGRAAKDQDLMSEYLNHSIERISLEFYCITLNSFLTGSI